ncbi:MAG: PEP-CTERM sorting domain-containing protein [Phycisphaerae bacterium]
MKKLITICLVVVCVMTAASGATFTLSDSALMSLDYKYPGTPTTVVSVTDAAGPGVRFDILYPDPRNAHGENPTLYLTSSIYGGNGSLTGIDISSFDAFALKFTLISAEGVSSTNAAGPIIVGAMINQSGSAYAYHPEVIAINSSYDPMSATSVTPTEASQINLVGFVCNIPYWWYDDSPSPWDSAGARISILVESAPNAVSVPEPATLLLLGLGGLASRRVCAHRSR